MRIKWLVLSSLLFTACSKDDIPTPIPKWGPDIQTKTNTPPTKVTFNADNFTLDGRLPQDRNGYYHLQLNPNTNQTTHRVTGTIKNTTQPIKVEWESNLYWWLWKDDVVAKITKTYINQFTGQLMYINLPPLTNWRDVLIPTCNSTSYSGTNGEINTMIAPVNKMRGDTLRLKCTMIEEKITKQINIVLE
jgi:hypothetical protein